MRLLIFFMTLILVDAALCKPLLVFDTDHQISTAAQLQKWQTAGFTATDASHCLEQATNLTTCINKAMASNGAKKIRPVALITAARASNLLQSLKNETIFSSIIVLANSTLDINAIAKVRGNSATQITVLGDVTLPGTSLSHARHYVKKLNRAGFDARFFILPPLQNNIFEVNRERSALLSIVGQITNTKKPRNIFDAIMRRQHQWQRPPLNNKPFFSQFAVLKKYAMDDELKRLFGSHLESESHLLAQFPQESYRAFDLIPYLQKREKRGAKDINTGFVYMETHNGSIINLKLSDYAQYEPVIVLALDDEKNLFRLPTFYLTDRQYSWKEAEKTQVSARVLGAFLHFRKPVPQALYVALNKRIAIRFESIAYHKDNPLAVLGDIPDNVLSTIIGNCVYCHQVRNVGGYAGHINAGTGKLQGGFALALESYPLPVLKAFLFNQHEVAKKIGVNANLLPEPTAKALFEWLKEEKGN